MEHHFFAYISRMKFIQRWGLMRNTMPENDMEHALQTGLIAHAMAVMGNRRYGRNYQPEYVLALAVYHDSCEVITGDLPTPIKHHNPAIKQEYNKLEDVAANHDYAFSFLQDIPLGDPTRLEGYLFPDTYNFYMGEDAKYVINKMLVNFDSKVDDTVRQKISESGYSIREILTIASMIEKETDGTDRTTIASVIYNRLNNPGASTAGYLQIDATIQYVLPEGKIVQESDYQGVDSPYNTYKNKGLPPGPIANPGMESITAALNPQSTNYYYYALGDDHLHHFFSSYAEHQAFLNS